MTRQVAKRSIADGPGDVYGFRWSDEMVPTRRTSRLATLRNSVNTVIARALARVPDRVLDSSAVAFVVTYTLPTILRMNFRASASTALCGRWLDGTIAVVAVLADGRRAVFLIRAVQGRGTISRLRGEDFESCADSAIVMRLPTVLRMFFGADLHPALLIASGKTTLWGNVFLTARLIPMLGIPTRSLLSDNRTQHALLDGVVPECLHPTPHGNHACRACRSETT